MDIRYCDECGDIIQAPGSPVTVGNQIMCPACAGAAPVDAVAQKPPRATKAKTEDLSAGVDEIPQFTLTSVMKDEGLDLFSSDTIALRKQASQKSESRLKLMDESPSKAEIPAARPHDPNAATQIHTPPSSSGGMTAPASAPMDAPAGMQTQDMSDPDLMKALAALDERSKPAAAPTRPASSAPQPTAQAAPQAAAPAPKQTVAPPAPVTVSGDRWTINCQHCQAQLSIKPVAQRSRMRCPRCNGQQVLDPAGTVQAVLTKQPAAPQSQQIAQIDMSAPPPPSMPMDQTIQMQAPASGPQTAPADTGPATMNMNPAAAAPSPEYGFAPASEQEESPTAIVAKLAGMARGADEPGALHPPAMPTDATINLSAAQAQSAQPQSTMGTPAMGHPGSLPIDSTIQMSPQTAAPDPQAAQMGHAPATAVAEPPRSFPVAPPQTAASPEAAAMHAQFTPEAPARAASAPAPTVAPAGRASATPVPSESAILWILVASLPTFAGLYLVSELSGEGIHNILQACGESVAATLERFLGPK